MTYPYIIQGSSITVVIGSKPHTISKSHVTYQKVLDAIKASDWDLVKNIVEPIKVVLNFGKGNVSVQGEQLFWKGKPMHNALTNRMIAMLQDGFPVEPLVAFMENLMTNPSKRAVDELYGFLEKNSLPITPDGCFLAYKKVRSDYMDIHSGTLDNSVGNIVEMERNEVDDNKDQTCSTGLHFCSQDYLPHFGSDIGNRVVILSINPRDVVSIPSDYNNAKGRACRYEVIGEIGNDSDEVDTAFTSSVQTNASNNISKVAVPEWGAKYKFNQESNGWVKTDAEVPAIKVNHGPFSKGYTDGYTHAGFDDHEYYSYKDTLAYASGFDAGQEDQEDGSAERYRYQPRNATAWAFPSKK